MRIFLPGSPNTEQTSGAVTLIGVQHSALVVGLLVALATVHTGLALLACGLGVPSLAPIAAATAMSSPAPLLRLIKTLVDGFEDGKDGVLVVRGEVVRHVRSRLVA